MSKLIARRGGLLAGAVIATTLPLTAPAHAAAGAVYGGSTSAHEPIVLRADRTGQRLRSAVMSWEAQCNDGAIFPLAAELPAVAPSPGISGGGFELLMSRNAKGRFTGVQVVSFQLGSGTADVLVRFAGKLRARSASGTLSADASIRDDGGNEVDACDTGTIKWNASRSPGRLFAGKTSQDEPIVVRLDAARTRVRNVLVGWQTAACRPEGFARFGESFTDFPLRGGRFGDAFEESLEEADGGKVRFTMDLAGRVLRRSASGRLQATITSTDPAGATRLSCDSSTVTWTAATG
jgi:hypothetical protein